MSRYAARRGDVVVHKANSELASKIRVIVDQSPPNLEIRTAGLSPLAIGLLTVPSNDQPQLSALLLCPTLDPHGSDTHISICKPVANTFSFALIVVSIYSSHFGPFHSHPHASGTIRCFLLMYYLFHLLRVGTPTGLMTHTILPPSCTTPENPARFSTRLLSLNLELGSSVRSITYSPPRTQRSAQPLHSTFKASGRK